MVNLTRCLILDIETTHLKPDFGTILCIGYKWLGEKKPKIISITDFPNFKKDPTDDSEVVKAFYPILVEADILVTYFGTGFDVKYITSKLLEHRLEFLPNTPHVDLFYVVKGKMLLSRKSLQNTGLFLGCTAQKTPISGRIWKRAMCGHRASIKYIETHCASDVNLTEEVYMRLRPLVRQHPRRAGLGDCRVCGGDKLQLRGRYVAVTGGEQSRIYCRACGAWGRIKL